MKQYLLKDIPEIVLRQFKAACAELGISMKQALLNFMKEFGKKKNG